MMQVASELRGRITVGNEVVLVKASEMIDPDNVIQLIAVCNSLDPPPVTGLLMIIPAIQRISPQLSRSRESIRRTARHTDRRTVLIQLEKFRMRPCIRAVKGYIDRDISHNLDLFAVRISLYRLSLPPASSAGCPHPM